MAAQRKFKKGATVLMRDGKKGKISTESYYDDYGHRFVLVKSRKGSEYFRTDRITVL